MRFDAISIFVFIFSSHRGEASGWGESMSATYVDVIHLSSNVVCTRKATASILRKLLKPLSPSSRLKFHLLRDMETRDPRPSFSSLLQPTPRSLSSSSRLQANQHVFYLRPRLR